MAEVLNVEKREAFGSAATTRIRREGRVPAVLYGHGQETQHLSISQGEVDALIRHHGRAVELKGALQDTAMVNDVQWDPLGIDILHLDLLRVNLQEVVDVTVSVHLHGEAPGVREGGILLESVHEVDVRCKAGSIPESVELSVAELHMGESATAAQLILPEGVELITDPETVLARVEEPRAEKDPEDELSSIGAEPEVIGAKKDEEGGDKG